MLFFPTLPTIEIILSQVGLQRYIFFLNMSCPNLCISSNLNIYSPFKIKRFADKVVTIGCTSRCYHQRTVTEYPSCYALGSLYALAPIQYQSATRLRMIPVLSITRRLVTTNREPTLTQIRCTSETNPRKSTVIPSHFIIGTDTSQRIKLPTISRHNGSTKRK